MEHLDNARVVVVNGPRQSGKSELLRMTHRARGQFALAGSTRFLTEPRLSESLAGRARFVDLWPLAQGEIERLDGGDAFVDQMFRGLDALVNTSPPGETRPAIFNRVVRGGFPEAVLTTSHRAQRAFFDDYVVCHT